IKLTRLRVGPDKRVRVASLELVCVVLKHLEVADAVVACCGLEHTRMKDQRSERGVTACAAAADDEAFWIRLALRDQVTRRVHRVLDVHDAPLPVETLAVRTTVSRTASVVHVSNREATRRPVLNRRLEPRGCRRRWSTVANDDQRRLFTGCAGVFRMS